MDNYCGINDLASWSNFDQITLPIIDVAYTHGWVFVEPMAGGKVGTVVPTLVWHTLDEDVGGLQWHP
jgi:hypothetical protein